MNDQRIAILTDTGTDTPSDFARAHDVRVVPLRITYSDGTTYESGRTITPAEVVARFAEEVPMTSLPSPEHIADAFRQARRDGYERAVFVGISSGLSATCETVRMVARQLADFPVEVVDSRSIGVAAGMVVMEAAHQVEQGVPFASLRHTLADVAGHTSVFFSTTTLDYLRHGGRISEAVYRLGTLLNLKPVITCDESGRYAVAKKCRGWRRALDAEVALAEERARAYPKVRLAICCSESCERHLMELERALRRQVVNAVEIVHSGVSADLLVHTGPDLVGIGVQGL